MCILKIYSSTSSFKEFSKTGSVPVFSVFDKGEYRNSSRTRICKEYVISLDVSKKDWDDFSGQVKDAIEFLSKYFNELEMLFSSHSIDDAYLDFPLNSRLNEEIGNQNDRLPKELISLAGKLNLGIEMATYS